ncbi:MAG: hypothetical protein RL707_1527, partial [Pseudomonadota bacterium]
FRNAINGAAMRMPAMHACRHT